MILATVRDITERKLGRERAIRESEEQHATLIESSSDAILMIDTRRNIVSCNQAFLDMFEYGGTRSKAFSTRILHQTEEQFTDFGDLAYPAVEQAGTFRCEWNFVRKNATIFPGETVTSAVRTPDGTRTGYVSIIRDITERKLAEDEIKRRNLELSALNMITASVGSS